MGLAGPLAEEDDMERFLKALSTPALDLRVVVAIAERDCMRRVAFLNDHLRSFRVIASTKAVTVS